MAKNIVLLFDGTSNEIAEDRTNILRLFGALKRNTDQIVYYDPGVGTFGAVNAWLKPYRDAVEIWGMGTGWGLDQNVKDAYRFIVENYEAAPRARGGRRDGEHDRLPRARRRGPLQFAQPPPVVERLVSLEGIQRIGAGIGEHAPIAALEHRIGIGGRRLDDYEHRRIHRSGAD